MLSHAADVCDAAPVAPRPRRHPDSIAAAHVTVEAATDKVELTGLVWPMPLEAPAEAALAALVAGVGIGLDADVVDCPR